MINKLIFICFCFYSISLNFSCQGIEDLQGDEKCEYDYEEFFDEDSNTTIQYDLLSFDDPNTALKVKNKINETIKNTISLYLQEWKWYKDKNNTLNVNEYSNGVWHYQGYISNATEQLREYAFEQKDADNIRHHLLSVGSLPYVSNLNDDKTTWGGLIGGITEYRSGFWRNGWSYVFTGDILRKELPDYQKEQMLWVITCHELGHQLADLSHVEDYPEEHGTDKDKCVMKSGVVIYSNFSADYRFCKDDFENTYCDFYLREELDNLFLE